MPVPIILQPTPYIQITITAHSTCQPISSPTNNRENLNSEFRHLNLQKPRNQKQLTNSSIRNSSLVMTRTKSDFLQIPTTFPPIRQPVWRLNTNSPKMKVRQPNNKTFSVYQHPLLSPGLNMFLQIHPFT